MEWNGTVDSRVDKVTPRIDKGIEQFESLVFGDLSESLCVRQSIPNRASY